MRRVVEVAPALALSATLSPSVADLHHTILRLDLEDVQARCACVLHPSHLCRRGCLAHSVRMGLCGRCAVAQSVNMCLCRRCSLAHSVNMQFCSLSLPQCMPA